MPASKISVWNVVSEIDYNCKEKQASPIKFTDPEYLLPLLISLFGVDVNNVVNYDNNDDFTTSTAKFVIIVPLNFIYIYIHTYTHLQYIYAIWLKENSVIGNNIITLSANINLNYCNQDHCAN